MKGLAYYVQCKHCYENSERFQENVCATALTGLIIEKDWTAVMKCLTAHDFDNCPITILHVACSIATTPFDVIKAIIKSYPSACLIEDEDGSLPIHIA